MPIVETAESRVALAAARLRLYDKEATSSEKVMAKEIIRLRKLLSQQTWQPIVTAPKDGTEILVFIPTYYQGKGGQRVASWIDFTDKPGWYSHLSGKHEPTLWQPLPAAPTQQGGE